MSHQQKHQAQQPPKSSSSNSVSSCSSSGDDQMMVTIEHPTPTSSASPPFIQNSLVSSSIGSSSSSTSGVTNNNHNSLNILASNGSSGYGSFNRKTSQQNHDRHSTPPIVLPKPSQTKIKLATVGNTQSSSNNMMNYTQVNAVNEPNAKKTTFSGSAGKGSVKSSPFSSLTSSGGYRIKKTSGPTTASSQGLLGSGAVLAVAANTRKMGKKYHIRLTKRSAGLGFSITTRDNPAGGNCPIYIKNILPKGAAITDGRLKGGDRLIEVNGIQMTGKSQEEAVNILKKIPVGSCVDLIVSRQESLFTAVDTSLPSPQLPRQMPSSESSSTTGPSSKTPLTANKQQREVLTYEIALNDTGSAGLGVSVKGRTEKIQSSELTPNDVIPTSNSSNSSELITVDTGIFVRSVIHGGAASKDGRLKPNDQLLSINSIPLLGLTNADAIETMRRAMLESRDVITLTVARLVSSSLVKSTTGNGDHHHHHNDHQHQSISINQDDSHHDRREEDELNQAPGADDKITIKVNGSLNHDHLGDEEQEILIPRNKSGSNTNAVEYKQHQQPSSAGYKHTRNSSNISTESAGEEYLLGSAADLSVPVSSFNSSKTSLKVPRVSPDSSHIVVIQGANGPLGIHVVAYSDPSRGGQESGLLIEKIETGGRADRDGRLNIFDVIVAVNDVSLTNVDFNGAQQIFKVALDSRQDIILRVNRMPEDMIISYINENHQNYDEETVRRYLNQNPRSSPGKSSSPTKSDHQPSTPTTPHNLSNNQSTDASEASTVIYNPRGIPDGHDSHNEDEDHHNHG